MALQEGSVLKGRYRIDEIIAQGGMGAIYKATDMALEVTVALKENFFSEEVAIRQFKAEAQILANLRHPNLPRVTDHFEIEDQGQYLIMDFIDGDDLKDILNNRGIISEEEAIKIGIDICNALDYLHRRQPPVVHRDIKPGNVKFSSSGVVHLVDFGLAKQAIAGEQTMTGAQALTPGFAPPEQYGKGTDPRTDIYSLGATLFAAVTLEAPPDGLTRATTDATFLDISAKNPAISQEFSAVINKAMEIHTENRYQSAREFRIALQTLQESINKREELSSSLNEATRLAPAVVDSEPVETPVAKKSSWWIPVGIVGFLAVVGVVIIALSGIFQQPDLEPTTETVLHANVSSTNTVQESETDDEESTPVPPTATSTENLPTATKEPTLTPTEPAPVIAPTAVGGGGSLIAFASDRNGGIPQVYVIDVNTREISQVTTLANGACQPDWSPDGQQIVFTSPCKKDEVDYIGSRLYTTSIDGVNLRPLATIPGGDFDPAWHPIDPNLIAFVSYRENNRPHLFIYHLDTNQVDALSSSTAYDRAPQWSPDGSMLLFQKVYDGITQVYTLTLDTMKLASITNGPVDAFDPTWSNSGQLIYFSEGKMGELSIRLSGLQHGNAAGTKFELEEPKPVWGLDFSSDDFWVAYYGVGDGINRDIFIMLSTGEMIDQLTDDAALDFDPKWQPVLSQ